VLKWNTDDVCRWLCAIGEDYAAYAAAFRKKGCNGRMLLALNAEKLKMLGVDDDFHQERILGDVQEANKRV
jgi:hypothetical protein